MIASIMREIFDDTSKSQVVCDCSLKWEVKFLLRLNNSERPIASKYREGKMKRTLKS
ncbi:hypothetical protein GLOIN_2v1501702 [Rhizophagus irregularis DAOM 181602=DAOM 197198]|uniref:Uncharacterized protein n=1 Tax=Rhizophagus irregularis (strain DAOM 181602 / DAOM 197198 / MUCL 43194) TaxID=747089 RepID=A0A2P4QWH2_RHIID|nr:hypothetical protein GLOIN_2v1501702 [Rhizophagus irregularis DAOM 181602=DAOM 197198]POG81996.1 hypothetical protein GLOIN_2v1501702 [Rhizophagus irregularis DAOM 181602=DAOM 197198]|eukprot:XP_025188862.1 hypothetical protein GLOIN_2v1501702 [Rhizophagus irregularis DAOM 181602=DAOM 197198]